MRYHLSALEEKGYIKREPGISRGIVWREHHPGVAAARGGVEVPLVGHVAAGSPILAVENVEGVLAVDEMFAHSKDCFALRVRGDSMKDAGIMDGDVVVVTHQNTADNGDIVVAMVDEAVTLKRFYVEKNRVRLKAENPKYPPLYTQNVRILGKLAFLMRTYV